jgi:iron(III) transport system substrate-binding protein
MPKIVTLLIGLLALGLASCSGTESLVIYSGQHYEMTGPLVSSFESQLHFNTVVRYGDEDTLVNQILAQGSSDTGCIFFAENSTSLSKLSNDNMLQTLPAAITQRVSSDYKSPINTWVGISARVSVLAYNLSYFKDKSLPQKVSQLASLKYSKLLGIAPQEPDFIPVIDAYLEKYGKAATLSWLKGLKQNAGTNSFSDDESLIEAINNGRVKLGIINSYYYYRLLRLDKNVNVAISFFLPRDPGYVLSVSGLGIIKNCKDQKKADRFITFVLSNEGQKIIAANSDEYPIMANIKTRIQPAFSNLKPFNLNAATLGDGKEAVNLLQEAELL